MRRCPRCGAEYFADERFCPIDGSRLEEIREVAAAAEGGAPNLLETEYELLDSLGRDELGEVFVANDRTTGFRVAVKRFDSWTRESASALRRYEQTLSRLKMAPIDNIPLVIGYRMSEEESYLASELVEGAVTLQDFVAKQEGVPLDEAIEIMLGVLSAVRQLHHIDVVHGGMTPRKILLAHGVDRTGIYLTDPGQFELWRVDNPIQASRKKPDRYLGSAQYYSPEAAMGQQVTSSADIYTAGLIFYEVLAGQPPFSAHSFATTLKRQIYERPLPPRLFKPGLRIPPAVESLIECALSKNVEGRFDTADAMFNAVSNLKQMVSGSFAATPSRTEPKGGHPAREAETVEAVTPEAPDVEPAAQPVELPPELAEAAEAELEPAAVLERAQEVEEAVEEPVKVGWLARWRQKRRAKREQALAASVDELSGEHPRREGGEDIEAEQPLASAREPAAGDDEAKRGTILLPAAKAMARMIDEGDGVDVSTDAPISTELLDQAWADLELELLKPPEESFAGEDLVPTPGDLPAVKAEDAPMSGEVAGKTAPAGDQRDAIEEAFGQLERELLEEIGDELAVGEAPSYDEDVEEGDAPRYDSAAEANAQAEDEEAEEREAPGPDADLDRADGLEAEADELVVASTLGIEPMIDGRDAEAIEPDREADDLGTFGDDENDRISGWFQAAPDELHDSTDEQIPFVDARRWNLRFAAALAVFIGVAIVAVVMFSSNRAGESDADSLEQAAIASERASDERQPRSSATVPSPLEEALAQYAVPVAPPVYEPTGATVPAAPANDEPLGELPPSEVVGREGAATEATGAAEPQELEAPNDLQSEEPAEEPIAQETEEEPAEVIEEAPAEVIEEAPAEVVEEAPQVEPIAEPVVAVTAIDATPAEEAPAAVSAEPEQQAGTPEEAEPERAVVEEQDAEPRAEREERASVEPALVPVPFVPDAIDEPEPFAAEPEPVEMAREPENGVEPEEAEPEEPVAAVEPAEEQAERRERSRGLAREGEEALENTDYDRAESLFREAIEVDDENARAYAGLGDVYFQRRDFASARRYHRRAVSADSHNAEFHSKLGMDYFRLERFEDAIESWERTLELDSSDTNASRYIDIARQRLGSPE